MISQNIIYIIFYQLKLHYNLLEIEIPITVREMMQAKNSWSGIFIFLDDGLD